MWPLRSQHICFYSFICAKHAVRKQSNHNNGQFDSNVRIARETHFILKLLKLRKQMLVAIEGLHRHEIGERIMVVVVLGDELRNHREVSHASGVHSGEEWMVQNAARGAFLHTNAPAQQNFTQKKKL